MPKEVDRAWLEEVQRRSHELDESKVAAVSWEQSRPTCVRDSADKTSARATRTFVRRQVSTRAISSSRISRIAPLPSTYSRDWATCDAADFPRSRFWTLKTRIERGAQEDVSSDNAPGESLRPVFCRAYRLITSIPSAPASPLCSLSIRA